MKSDLGRAVRVIIILFLVAFAGAAKAQAQSQLSLTNIPNMPGPAIGEQFTELSSGIFTYSKTDLNLPGPMPINVTRVHRSTDETSGWNNRAFGLGTRLNYDMFGNNGSSSKSVSMPDSSVLYRAGSFALWQITQDPVPRRSRPRPRSTLRPPAVSVTSSSDSTTDRLFTVR